MLRVQFFHDDIGRSVERVLLVLLDPKLRLDLGHSLGQLYSLFRIVAVEQMPKREMKHFTVALMQIVYRQSATQLLILTLSRNSHAHEEGAARFHQHGIRRIEGIRVDEIVREPPTGRPGIEIRMLACRGRVDRNDQTAFGKETIERRPQDVAVHVLDEGLNTQIVDGAAVIEMHVLRPVHVPLERHILKGAGKAEDALTAFATRYCARTERNNAKRSSVKVKRV